MQIHSDVTLFDENSLKCLISLFQILISVFDFSIRFSFADLELLLQYLH